MPPFLRRVEETFPEDPGGLGSVRITIEGITSKKWTWLQPILEQLLQHAPFPAKRTPPAQDAKRATDGRART